ncbi:uncharacterized protein LOC120636542 [Pararge aegeria]|uniref:Jg26083 protein n=1 Tax=Pararge aegeria aegeria TaxID=348720 RepID=A0A8S4QRE3_9NEOP|nr:uncharacterized protein LOC120636542 [Pararge aegeria]XP_039763999.1 uncharacterized protein LOC120636542 [Pararge aegeria]XP_039764001.1 uncharacterized protein LOC120636542 [Pararge aegeria]XP_039764002.1 uncharacterized protein LOC120636542 [Pararge aegeria]XP_039764003.1 uncharacterized protein LOC120636542 [Pararge aegeria]CAH2217971.1 jg26083 [Pararge aegeria aegeria]
MENIIKEVMAEVSATKFNKDSYHWMDVTCIKDPHNFYVRPKNCSEFLHIVETTKPTDKVQNITKNKLILFNWGYFCRVKKYLRGLITNAKTRNNNIQCDIWTVDYGHTEKDVPIQHIWQCNQLFSQVPPLVYICQLSNCYPIHDETNNRRFSAAAIKAFKFFVANEPAKIDVVGHSGKKLIVVLVNSNPYDIATLMAIRAFSVVGGVKDTIQWNPTIISRQVQFLFKEINVNQTLHVRMQSGKSFGEFYVSSISDYRKYLKEIDIIQFYARREFVLFNHNIVEGVPVCAKDEERDVYERGFIKKINMPEKKAIVQLVDWGRDEEYPFTMLKYMPSVIFRMPVLTIFCSARRSNQWGADLETFLTPGYEFLITIKHLGCKFECPNSVEIFPLDNHTINRGDLRF